ncbi:MAG: hypothetical protein HRU33_23895 [Rhodobacteraceae bacterium]|nr:hypothetical protein [Paracoccaceae bacterium]
MFYFYQADGSSWAEFDCPICQVDMDFDLEAVPAKGADFTCPNCAAQMIAEHANDETK